MANKDLQKIARKAQKSAGKNLKKYKRKLKREAKIAQKGAVKSYSKLNFEQKAAFYGGFVVFVAVLSWVFSRATK